MGFFQRRYKEARIGPETGRGLVQRFVRSWIIQVVTMVDQEGRDREKRGKNERGRRSMAKWAGWGVSWD